MTSGVAEMMFPVLHDVPSLLDQINRHVRTNTFWRLMKLS